MMPCDKLLKNLSVLFVEDEQNLLHLLTDAIGSQFLRYDTASNGMDGLEKFSSMQPDIVITDITMPKMDGLTMADNIHKLDEDIPIIVLSAYSDRDKLLHAIDAGVTKYFIKPFDPEELLEFICKLSKKTKKHTQIKLLNPYVFDSLQKKLYKNKVLVRLTKREVGVIDYLIKSDNGIISNEKIKELLGKDKPISDESTRVFIKRLREKTSKDFIQNLPKQGYVLQTHR